MGRRIAELRRTQEGERLFYPWRDMYTGDWFDVLVPEGDLIKADQTIRFAARAYASRFSENKPAFKISRSSLTDESLRGIRVWRIDGLQEMPANSDGRHPASKRFSGRMIPYGRSNYWRFPYETDEDRERLLQEFHLGIATCEREDERKQIWERRTYFVVPDAENKEIRIYRACPGFGKEEPELLWADYRFEQEMRKRFTYAGHKAIRDALVAWKDMGEPEPFKASAIPDGSGGYSLIVGPAMDTELF